MSAVTKLDEYRQRANEHHDRWLGSIIWFSISGTVDRPDGRREVQPVRVQPDVLRGWFKELGLDEKYLPPEIKKVDAFAVATSEASAKYDLPGDKQSAELLIREVTRNDEYVLRHIMRETKDEKGQRLSYDQVATLKFFRGARSSAGKRHSSEHYKAVVLNTVHGVDLTQVNALIRRIEARYTDLCANLGSQAIRGVVRNYVKDLNAVAVKSNGGVYFVHTDQQATVDALQTLVSRIGQGCVFHQLPLIDTPSQREMVTEAYQNEVEDQVRLLLAEVAKANEAAKARGGKIPPKTYAKLMADYQSVQGHSEVFSEKMGLAQGRAGAALELALDGVMDLAERIG